LRDSVTNTDGYGDWDGNNHPDSNCDGDTYCYSNSNSNTYTDSNTKCDADCYTNSNRNGHINANTNSYNNAKGDTDTEVSSKSEASSHAAPSPVSGS